ncbi:DUF5808 domain-containing protein [Clostridium sp. Ade.TY]|uniref:DUF1648 domain-containing protein n=1 Tax=Clostridium sp. Ade.TY TaxID=1391647 RepID=UPI00040BC9F5|nr:DUF5808 domain-containing protein [Clostridium sp. Ade.TY]
MFDTSYLIIMTLVVIIEFYSMTILPIKGKKQLLLGCVVTEEMKNNKEVKGLVKKYKWINIIISIIAELFIILSYFKLSIPLSVVAIFFAIFGSMISFGIYNEKMKNIKKRLGGLKGKKQVIIYELEDSKYNFKTLIFYIVTMGTIILVNLYFSITRYSKLPDIIATNFDFQGNIIGYSQKNYFTVFSLIGTMVFMLAIFIFIDFLIQRQKLKIDPRNPEKSREGNLKYRKLLSNMMIFTGLLTMIIVTIGNFQMLQVIPMNSILINLVLILIVFMFVVLFIFMIKAYKVRNNYKVEDDNVVQKDDDNNWKFGIIYYNKDDPRVNVEKRFGMGYTVNAATKTGMAIYIGIVIVLIVTLVITFTQT